MSYLKSLKRLNRLSLESTRVSDSGTWRYLAGLKNLEVLFLSGTNVGDAGLAHLRGLTQAQKPQSGLHADHRRQLANISLGYRCSRACRLPARP